MFTDVLGVEKEINISKTLEYFNEKENCALIIVNDGRSILDKLNGYVINKELRDYGVGAQILRDLGLKKITLLTTSKSDVVAIDGYDLEIIGYESL